MSVNMDRLFQETARRQPTHPAILGPDENRRMTYAELDEAIETAAESLREAGLSAGDCVGLHYPSGRDYIVLTYAAWRCGACIVPLATELAHQEKQEICREIALDHIVAPTGTAAFAETFLAGPERPLTGRAALMSIESPCSRPAEFSQLHAAFIRFTSGTTGSSKGVVLSHETIRDRIEAANEALAIGPQDRILWLLPMAYHFTVSIVSYLSFGATILLPANHFAAAVVALGQREQATLIYASPSHYALLADYALGGPLPELRLAISTTSALDSTVAQRFYERYGQPLVQALGIIEVGLPCMNLDFAATKFDSVGRVLPAYEVRLEDVGLGEALQVIWFRGKGMLDAYYRPWQTRDQILRDGWFCTGDVGEMDAEGCLYLHGRRNDVICSMGMKFFPQEVELVLEAHPAVAEAGVFAHHDDRHGEVPYAWIVCQANSNQTGLEEELRTWCEQRLASYKVPERIEFVASLPRTASGKLLHRLVAGGTS